MKKKIIPIILIPILILAFVISIPLVNNHSAKRVENRLLEIALPEETILIESLSAAGKFIGNGNGMQYFGAMLVKSTLTLDEISAFYAEQDADIIVKPQEVQAIECLDHGQLSFESKMNGGDMYYIVYTFGSGISPFSELDVRGH